MKFSQLLLQRDALLRQARLANVAFAYHRLGEFAARIARARLQGVVILRDGDPAGEQPWPRLHAEEGSQAVLEEHFIEEDVSELADILAFLHDAGRPLEVRFRLEDLAKCFLPRLRRELEQADIVPGRETPRIEDTSRGAG